MTKREFYRKIVEVEILSEEPIGPIDDLSHLDHMITMGDCSGQVNHLLQHKLDGKQMAVALMDQGSDPGFFRLTETGEDTDDE